MGRGKIEIKKIEEKTSRQVTFSKRKNGLMKKAHELSLLCDATVSLLLVSSSDKLHHYLTPGAQLKKIYDDYEKFKCVDLWSTHYQIMQEQKRKLLEMNNILRSHIRQRMGGDLENLGIKELRVLEQDMAKTLDVIRTQKLYKIKAQTGTCRKKVRNLEQVHGNLLFNLESKFRAPHYCLAKEDDKEDDYGEEEGATDNCFYGRPSHHGPSHFNLLDQLHGDGGGHGNDLRLA